MEWHYVFNYKDDKDILYMYILYMDTLLKGYLDINNLIPLFTCLTHREQHVISYIMKTDLYYSVKVFKFNIFLIKIIQ